MNNSSGSGLKSLLDAATRLREGGRFGEAIKAYEAVLGIAPNLATAWYNLGFCQRMAGYYEASLESYQRAVDHGLKGREEAHLNRAVIFADMLRRDGDAKRELDNALEANPRYVPALLNLANLAEDFGNREEARVLYERALSIEPECWEALARHANIMPEGANFEQAATRLRTALSKAEISDADGASLGFALGRVLDRAGAYDEAFFAYARANALSRAAQGGVPYDRHAAERQVQRIVEVFSEGATPKGSSAWSPIFICGMFRSGSTLLEQVLAGHERVTPGGEIALMPDLVRTHVSPFPARACDLDDATFAALGESYRRAAQALYPRSELITDKWLGNVWHIGVIKKMFPGAKIVYTQRNALDNIISVYFLHLSADFAYAFDLGDIAHQLVLSRRIMRHWIDVYPDDIIVFDYDEFVSAPENAARGLLSALDLGWEPACLNFEQRSNAVKTASVWQVRQPLYTSSSGRWRHYERHLGKVRETLSREVH